MTLAKPGPMPGLDLSDDIEKILPCPFCGGRETETVMNDGDVSLECLHCHAHGPWVDEALECPAEAWNSRDPDTTHVVEDPGYE